jgi:O-acetyl-ADP-ribose deacetylase (regulator of RNase III)
MVRNRERFAARTDAWQLELLCNIAAAEILMPPGPALDFSVKDDLTIDDLPSIWKKFDVSAEALLIRIARLTGEPISVFAASRLSDAGDSEFRIDYCLASKSSHIRPPSGLIIPRNSVLSECTAIGFTSHRTEVWPHNEKKLYVECVGIPPYPEKISPRILGILRLHTDHRARDQGIQEVYGDVRKPRGEGRRIIAHIVNERIPTWGAGVARAIADRWPSAQADFREWAEKNEKAYSLGEIHEFAAEDGISIVSMIAQHGYGKSRKPRIRYGALAQCLSKLATLATESKASVHMPRIGTGFAGGSWDVILSLIRENLVTPDLEVVIYRWPGRRGISPQPSLLELTVNQQT